MKDNFVAGLLVGVFALTVVSAAVLSAFLNLNNQRARRLQGRMAEIQNTQNVLQSLANDAVEYGKHNPAIMPVLQNFGLVGNPPTVPAPAAPAKPAPKTNSKATPKAR
ncbi:MAG TPA: hypothetical protein VI454_13340 [Verrucomicrobiae bacterium]|jgi:hypothetical protein